MIFKDIELGKIINTVLTNDNVTDLMIWEKEVWVTDINKGHYQYNLNSFSKEEQEEYYSLIEKIPRQVANRMGVNFNDSSPVVDGEFVYDLGQLRINCIHESLNSSSTPSIAIRKSKHDLRINKKMLIHQKYAEEGVLDLLAALVYSGNNVIIAGLTGSGKTELLRFLSGSIRKEEAIITIEDTLEAYLKNLYKEHNILSLKSSDHIGFKDLIRASLRQNPDWILVSETRNEEVLELIDAASTGHHLISTVHSSSAYKIPNRFISMSKVDGSYVNTLIEQIYSNIDIGIYIDYRSEKQRTKRKITEVVEFYIDGQGNKIVRPLYVYDFKEKKAIKRKITSPNIIKRLYQSKTDLSNLKEYVW